MLLLLYVLYITCLIKEYDVLCMYNLIYTSYRDTVITVLTVKYKI